MDQVTVSKMASSPKLDKLADDSLGAMRRPFTKAVWAHIAAYSLCPDVETKGRALVVAGIYAELYREMTAAITEAKQRGPNGLVLERDVVAAFRKNGRPVPLAGTKGKGYRCPASVKELEEKKKAAAEDAVVHSEGPRHARHIKRLSESL